MVKFEFFVNNHIHVGVISGTEQQLTPHLTFEDGNQILATIIYVKCCKNERLRLWNDLYSISHNFSLPFNCIFKKINGVVVNQGLLNHGNIYLQHLARTKSDHAPLLLSCGVGSQVVFRPFKFLKFWIVGEKFIKIKKNKIKLFFLNRVEITLEISLSIWLSDKKW
ncbi:hypothetical protein H5410_027893 [Solanum commersonii]|uniref:Uncharacterized protein n=1 Tax=Solanum commersonii TaxID=4109 RepID=A0A9J5Z0G1_SOLCO|nr:hypothetical protein H5410_027893 [Solanum commersonii]